MSRPHPFLLAAALLSAPALGARHAQVTASGQAVTVGDPAQARGQALASAQRHAVEEVAVQLGGPREGSDPVVDRSLYERAAAFITRGTITNESIDGTILSMDLSAEVDSDGVAAALGSSRGRALTPSGGAATGGRRVLILATEQLGPHQVYGWTDIVWGPGGISTKTTAIREVTEMGSMEATFADGLGGSGFTVIDPHVLRGKLSPRPAFEVLDLSVGEARQIAQRGDADLVVVAKGVAQTAGMVGEMHSGQANVVARLVRVRDGKVVGSTTQHAAQVHIDAATARLQALDEATRMAASALAQKFNSN